MVDKSSCSSGASAVHALFYTAAEICYFCVFTTEFNYHIRLRNKFFYGGGSGNNFLYKRNIQPLRNGKPSGTGNFYRNSLFLARRKFRFDFIESFINYIYNCTADIGTVSPVIRINNIIVIIKNSNFYGSGTYINSYPNRYNISAGILTFFHKTAFHTKMVIKI